METANIGKLTKSLFNNVKNKTQGVKQEQLKGPGPITAEAVDRFTGQVKGTVVSVFYMPRQNSVEIVARGGYIALHQDENKDSTTITYYEPPPGKQPIHDYVAELDELFKP